jgi:hypothetical protein
MDSRKSSSSYDVCAICLDEIENEGCDQPIMETECHHIFHEECFDEWAKRSACCPYCRHILTTDFDIYTYDIHFNNLSVLLKRRINFRKKRWALTLTDNTLHLQRHTKNTNQYQPMMDIKIKLNKVKWFKCKDDFLMLHILKPNGQFYNKTLYFKKKADNGLFFDHLMNHAKEIVAGNG